MLQKIVTYKSIYCLVGEILEIIFHFIFVVRHWVLFLRRESVIRFQSNSKHLSFIYLFLNINQLDALNFIISLFQASTCFEHMCSKHVEA